MLAAGHRQKLLFFVIHQPEGGVTVAHSAGLRQGSPRSGSDAPVRLWPLQTLTHKRNRQPASCP